MKLIHYLKVFFINYFYIILSMLVSVIYFQILKIHIDFENNLIYSFFLIIPLMINLHLLKMCGSFHIS